MWRIITVALALSAAAALPAQDAGHTDNDIEGYSDCLRKDSTSCLKYKFFSFVDKMIGSKDTFALTEGVTVVRAKDVPTETGAPRSMDPLARLRRYLDTHSIQVEVKGSDVIDTVTGVGRALEETVSTFTEDNDSDNDLSEESRGKKKKAQKILGPLMMALAMKMMALMPIAIGAIALIAGKALLIGKIALVLSAIIGLKKLLSQQKHVTYEVVAHPHSSSSHSSSHDYGSSSGGGGTSGYGGDSSSSYGAPAAGGHSSGGWGRSADAQALAYSAQKPL